MLNAPLSSTIDTSRVVIMGAKGFVGSASSKILKNNEINVLELSRSDVDLLSDGADKKLAAHLKTSDTLIVTSANAPVKNLPMLLDNLRMLQNVCNALKIQPVKHLVYISSDAVYSDSSEPLHEKSCAEPQSLHGAMHITREVMLKFEVECPSVFIRPTLVYGIKDPHNGYGPNRFVRLAKENKDIVLFGEGEEKRDHVFIEDLAEIVRLCVVNRTVGIINAVSGAVTSFRECAQLVVDISKSSSRILSSPRLGPMPHNGYRAFDSALLHINFPKFKCTSLRDGLEKMIAS